MANRVKCQHCWKIFEIPDHALNKPQKCIFCQRITNIQLVESREKKPTVQVKSVAEESVKADIGPMLNMLLACLLVLTIANFSFLCYLAVSLKSARQKAATQTEKAASAKLDVEKKLGAIETRLDECQTALNTLDNKIVPRQDVIRTLMLKVTEGFKIISETLAPVRREVEKLREQK